MSKLGVTVVVPVYNNASTVGELARRVRAALADRPVEIVFVDDGSTDESAHVIEHLDARLIVHGGNRGQNAAILSGLRCATQPLACVMDADLEDPPEGIPLMLATLGRSNVVFSSRDEPRPASSRLFRWIIARLFPSLPPHPCLCFAIDEAGRAALLGSAHEDDYLPAVIGALELRAAQATVARGQRTSGESAYRGVARLRYAWGMLTAAVRVWWDRRTRRARKTR